MRVICVIPARGGSKRIKNKNILKINSKPLINLVLKNIIKSKIIDRIVVFTNSKIIKKKVFKLKKNNKIFINSRSKKSERDTASTESLLNEINHSMNLILLLRFKSQIHSLIMCIVKALKDLSD